MRHPRSRRGDGRVQPDAAARARGSICRASAATPPTSPSRPRARARKVGYLSALGDDVYGAMLRAIWREEGVEQTQRAQRRRRLHRDLLRQPRRRRPPLQLFSARLGGEPPRLSRSCRARASRRRACCICRASRWRSRTSHKTPAGPRSRSRARPACRSPSTPTCAEALADRARAPGDRARDRARRHLPAEPRRPRAPDRTRRAGSDARPLPRPRREDRRAEAWRQRRLARRRDAADPDPAAPRAGQSMRPAPATRSAAPSSRASWPATISRPPAATPRPRPRSRPRATARSRRSRMRPRWARSTARRLTDRSLLARCLQVREAGLEVRADHLVHADEDAHQLRDERRRAPHQPRHLGLLALRHRA